jgi:hypothetical protein
MRLWSPTHAAMKLRHGWGTRTSVRNDKQKEQKQNTEILAFARMTVYKFVCFL